MVIADIAIADMAIADMVIADMVITDIVIADQRYGRHRDYRATRTPHAYGVISIECHLTSRCFTPHFTVRLQVICTRDPVAIASYQRRVGPCQRCP